MDKPVLKFSKATLSGAGWQRLVFPIVTRGSMAFPQSPGEQEMLGLCLDSDGEITGKDDVIYNKLQVRASHRR